MDFPSPRAAPFSSFAARPSLTEDAKETKDHTAQDHLIDNLVQIGSNNDGSFLPNCHENESNPSAYRACTLGQVFL
jgi:hypothetical protein